MNNNEMLRKINKHEDKDIPELREQLDNNVQKLNSKINEVATTGTTTEVLKTTTETYIQEKINDGTIPNMTIENTSIDTEKTKFITKYENLFNKENIILGKFLGGQVGSVASEFESESFFYYILPCKKGDVLTVSATSFVYLEMDNDNRILVRDGNESTNVSNVTITITNENTTRLAINARMTVFPIDKYMIVRGNNLPDNYVAYGDTITALKENFIFNDKQKEDIKNIVGNSTYYVSPTGSDENDGLSKTTPFATFQKAIDLGAKNINAFSGEYKGQTLICSDKEELNIRVIEAPYEQATLEKPKANFINYEVIEVNAYENIYVATIPIQTGNYNKVFVTKELPIIKTGLRSESYNAILWEINKGDMSKDIKLKPVLTLEECKSTNGTFFYDGNTSLYINPKYGTVENKEFRKLILETGIKIKLSKINKMCLEDLKFLLYPEYARIENCNNTQITACEAGYNAYSGGFSTYNTNCRFDYCKGYKNTGDGFAPVGHGNNDFYNCQGYYNYDDGLSHHDNTTGIVVGGEYHHNAQKGVAPAHGAMVDIHNPIVHHNKYGIYSQADAGTNQGKVVRHVGIVSYENEYGIRVRNYKVLSYNCKYINNTVKDKDIGENEFTSFTEL